MALQYTVPTIPSSKKIKESRWVCLERQVTNVEFNSWGSISSPIAAISAISPLNFIIIFTTNTTIIIIITTTVPAFFFLLLLLGHRHFFLCLRNFRNFSVGDFFLFFIYLWLIWLIWLICFNGAGTILYNIVATIFTVDIRNNKTQLF